MNNQKQPHAAVSRKQWISILGALGCILLFLFILLLTYIPDSEADPMATTVEQRTANLEEVRTKAAREMVSLEVIDAEEGTYKIPIDQAMEITVREYNKQEQ